MLTQKTFAFDTEFRTNDAMDWVSIGDSVKITVASEDLRCMPVDIPETTEDIVRMYASEEVFANWDFVALATIICDAFDVNVEELGGVIYVPTCKIRNKITNKANMDTSGRWVETRIGKRGERRAFVGKRMSMDGNLTDKAENSVDIPCTTYGALRPFKTIGINDVWHIIRPQFSVIMADRLHADSRHVRITMRYVGSMDIRG